MKFPFKLPLSVLILFQHCIFFFIIYVANFSNLFVFRRNFVCEKNRNLRQKIASATSILRHFRYSTVYNIIS